MTPRIWRNKDDKRDLSLRRRPPHAMAAVNGSPPVYNPATGEVSGQVALASAQRSATRSQRKAAAPDGLRQLHCAAPGFSIASCISSKSVSIRWPKSSARARKIISDAKGEVQRGMEVVEFATGAPQCLRAKSRRMSERGSTATRFANPSASFAASRPSTFRRWCPCGCFRSRSLAAIVSF